MSTAASRDRLDGATARLRGFAGAFTRSAMAPFARTPYPVGAHFADDGVVYVGWIDQTNVFHCAREPYRDSWDHDPTVQQRGTALQRAHANLPGAPAVCVMATSVSASPFGEVRLPPDMKPHERLDAALYQMKSALKDEIEVDVREYFAALEAFDTGQYNVGIVPKALVQDARDVATAASMKLARYDHEARVWRRLLVLQKYEAAVITGAADVIVLVFNKLRLHVHTFERSRLSNDWAAEAEKYIGNLRERGIADPGAIAILGDPAAEDQFVSEFARKVRRDVSFLEVTDPLTHQPVIAPPWLLAYGLALPENKGN